MKPPLSILALAAAAFLHAAAAAGPPDDRPGATLLIPYFEVDLDDPGGRDTLFSVNNAGLDPALAHVVLWTDRGHPTLAFDVYLDADAVSSMSVRRLFEGRRPATGDASTPFRFPGCTVPLTVPALDAGELAELRARHTGRPSPADGLCYGAPHEDAGLAVGYVTVDVVRDCSGGTVYPGDPGYFGTEETPGLADFRNVLWGDVVLVDPREGAAQGFAAVAREARQGTLRSFWESSDLRQPLGERSRSRFFAGGAFDGGTDLVIWQQGSLYGTEPVPCDATPGTVALRFGFTDEAGESLAERNEPAVTERVVRRTLGGDLPAPSRFGFVEVSGERLGTFPGVPAPEALPLLVVPMATAEDRFSVAFTAPDTGAPPPPPAGARPQSLGYAAADVLYEVDPDRGTFRRLPATGWGPIHGLASAPDGRLFGFISGDLVDSTTLLEVFPATGETRYVDEYPAAVSDLAVDSDGGLWLLLRREDELRRVDPASGEILATLRVDRSFERLVASAAGLFGWTRDDNRYGLAAIDRVSGSSSPVLSLDLDGLALVGSDFDRDGNLRLVGVTRPPATTKTQRFYRVLTSPEPGLPVEAEVTYERRIGHSIDSNLAVYDLATIPAASERPRGGGARGAATLLVPYFEVDLERSDGVSTLFSVDNAGDEPVLAHVVLWTDGGVPSLAFDFFLDARAGRILDLRRIFADGTLPSLDPRAAELHPGCGGAATATVDAAALVARHLGRPDPSDGLCYAPSRPDDPPPPVVGFATVDVVRDCSPTVATPNDDGYFGAEGLAGDANVLTGEVFLIDGAGDQAQGFAAVAVPSDPDLAPGSPTFYGRADDRRPLGCLARARYFENGVFDGGTELLVWARHSPLGGAPAECPATTCPMGVHVTSRAEAGGAFDGVSELVSHRQVLRLAVGGKPVTPALSPTLPVPHRFGSVDVSTLSTPACARTGPLAESVQTWVVPLLSARGRFSVAVEAAGLAGVCR